jgi:hypothetical protein
MRVLKSIDLSGLTDIRLRNWLLTLAKNQQAVSGTIVTTPPGPISGGTTIINNFGLQFVNDLVYGALLNQGLGWARNRLSFNPNTSTDPLVIDTNATKRAFPFVVLTQNFGYVTADAQDPPHYWQFRTSADGIPFCEDKGFVTDNPLLSLV